MTFRGSYIQMAFFSLDSQMGVPKLRLLLSQSFRHSYLPQINFLLHARALCYSPQKDLSNNVSHALTGDHSTLTLRGFVVGNQVHNLVPILSFDHNSCISYLNEQWEGTWGIYTSRTFQWYPKVPIWCLFTFLTKAMNIQDSRMSATPKVGVHLGVIGFHPLHSPPFVRMCFTPKHTFLALWALAFHI
jgi:hypothetical protein